MNYSVEKQKQHNLLPPLHPPVIGFDSFTQVLPEKSPSNFGLLELWDGMTSVNFLRQGCEACRIGMPKKWEHNESKITPHLFS